MPLHADDETPRPAGHLDAFHHAVGAPGREDEVLAQALDRLMVEAVHRDSLRSQDLAKPRLRQDLHLVAGLPPLDVGIVRTRTR
jgi:hypothetical protein